MPRQPPRADTSVDWALPPRPRDWLTVGSAGPSRQPICVCDGWPALVGLLRELEGSLYRIQGAGRLVGLASRLSNGCWHICRYGPVRGSQ